MPAKKTPATPAKKTTTKKAAPAKRASSRSGPSAVALAKFEERFAKTFGPDLLSRSAQINPYEVISTGSLTLDYRLTVGGYVAGRLVEIWGPDATGKTTLALIAIAEAQKKHPGKMAAFIDMEQKLDKAWAVAHGVDLTRLYHYLPESAEDVADAMKEMLRSNLISMIVLDSIGAMIPEAEKTKDADESAMGKQAGIITRMVKLAAVEAHNSETVVILVNQVRANLGYGCVHGDTLVPFVDGTSVSMRDVVRNKINGEVWSWSETEGRFLPRHIIDWHDNGRVEGNVWVHFTTDVIEARGGRHGLSLTPEHLVMTPSGWRPARELQEGDRMTSTYRTVVHGHLHDFLWGTLVGDCHVTAKGQLSMQDSTDPEYVRWKTEMLSPAFEWREQSVGNRISYRSSWHHELRRVKDELGQRDPVTFLRNHYSLLGLAVWYMDDGWIEFNGTDVPRAAISVPRGDSGQMLTLLAEHGWKATYTNDSLYLSRKDSARFFNQVAHLIHPSMERKLPESLRGQFRPFTLPLREEQARDWVTILRRQDGRSRDLRWPSDATKYDLTVEGEHNYLVGGRTNGVVVHNSDTTTGGGFALKHCTTMKFKMKRTATPAYKVKIGTEERIVGHEISIYVERNGVGPAYRTAIISLFHTSSDKYGPIGIDVADETASMGIDTGVISRAGAWYTLPGGHRVNGKDLAVDALREDPVLLESVRVAVLASVAGEIVEEEVAPEEIPEAPAGQEDSPEASEALPDDVLAQVEEGTVNTETGEITSAPRFRTGLSQVGVG